MLNRETALSINTIVLILAGLMDIRRGIAHTFQVKYSAEHLAGIELIPDSLMLMGAFGVSNFLTGFIFLLIGWKAKHLSPYILLLIPVSYFIGGMGIASQRIQPDGEFIGRYMLVVYMSICLIAVTLYFLSKKRTA